MLQIELSALSAQELKRLLDVARSRGQTSLAEQLVAELDARPTRAADWRQTAPPFGQMAEPEPEPDAVRSRRSGAMAATAALAAFVSAAVTWGLSLPTTSRPQPSAAVLAEPAPRAAVVLASLAPVSAPPRSSESPAAPAEPEHVAVPRPLRLAKAEPVGRARARANPCYDLPTPAERLVCGYPSLAAQDRQLRAAYDRALAAGVDRRNVDRSQATWRGESEQVTDRKVLAERYARRIRELDSAAVPASPPEEPVF